MAPRELAVQAGDAAAHRGKVLGQEQCGHRERSQSRAYLRNTLTAARPHSTAPRHPSSTPSCNRYIRANRAGGRNRRSLRRGRRPPPAAPPGRKGVRRGNRAGGRKGGAGGARRAPARGKTRGGQGRVGVEFLKMVPQTGGGEVRGRRPAPAPVRARLEPLVPPP